MTERRRTMVERVQDIQKIQQPQNAPPPAMDSVEIIPDDIPEAIPVAEVIEDGPAAPTVAKKPPTQNDCEIFRPTNRPPMGVLVIRDDGATTGEKIRLRTEATLIGREGCDINIANDPAISTRHAEIVRVFERGAYRWYIRDLGSTNGTFVRVFKTNLKHDQEWMIGSRRYQYKMVQFDEADAKADSSSQAGEATRHNSTQGWQAPSLEELQKNKPSLINILPTGEEGQVLPFTGDKMKLGCDASQCQMVVENDPYLSKVHAQISRTPAGHWRIKDAKSVNGIWLRATSLPIERTCEFQLGEQRFLFCIV